MAAIRDEVTERQIAHAEKALEQMEGAWGRYSRKLIPHMQYLCDLHYALGDYAQAEAIGLRLLSVITKNDGYDSVDAARALQMMGEVCEMECLTVEAERYYLWALQIRLRLGHSDDDLKILLARLANLYRADGNRFKSRVIETKLRNVVFGEDASGQQLAC
jgi:tetratricopeptide (TPR) repeat protein